MCAVCEVSLYLLCFVAPVQRFHRFHTFATLAQGFHSFQVKTAKASESPRKTLAKPAQSPQRREPLVRANQIDIMVAKRLDPYLPYTYIQRSDVLRTFWNAIWPSADKEPFQSLRPAFRLWKANLE